jgi:acyl carrier protein
MKPQPPPLRQLERRIIEIVSDQTGIPRNAIKPSSRLIEDLHIDSLDRIEVMAALEDEFAIVIPDHIGKQMFVREPITIRVLAQIVAQQWGTGTTLPQNSDRATTM